MKKGRLEAFSDGVLAIIITIMVLDMKAPEETTVGALAPVLPVFLSYVLSFIYVAIYWINHHHLFQATSRISTGVLWANMHLLFWLSLIPFVTSWLGENHLEPVPVAFYGGVLFMSAVAFRLLERTLMRSHDKRAPITRTLNAGRKENASIVLYLAGIPLAFVHIAIPITIYVVTALIWFIPAKELETAGEE
ncbi:MAG: TMEM175 family protein [Rikenellaceae bacterium]|nr:TMEM175 family protein [Rikenellaceae bacterium]